MPTLIPKPVCLRCCPRGSETGSGGPGYTVLIDPCETGFDYPDRFTVRIAWNPTSAPPAGYPDWSGSTFLQAPIISNMEYVVEWEALEPGAWGLDLHEVHGDTYPISEIKVICAPDGALCVNVYWQYAYPGGTPVVNLDLHTYIACPFDAGDDPACESAGDACWTVPRISDYNWALTLACNCGGVAPPIDLEISIYA